MDMVEILKQTVARKASDLHLSIGRPPMMRIHGELEPQKDWKVLEAADTERLIMQIISEDQRKELNETLELDCSYSIPGTSRFRVNVYWRNGGMGAAIRTIPNKIPTIQELELPPVVERLTQAKNGLILVTGPTGSGKSTTLAAMIDMINRTRKDHIMTIEDPIEFVYEHNKALINQRELNAHTLSFTNALKHVLRQDPDVVLVGEMRDLETIASAITIAETGHLVFGTLHTMGAAQTIDRIVDVFPSYQQQQIRMQLAGGLRAVISQTLLARKSGGRVAAREIMIVTQGISSMIREGKTHQLYGQIQTGASEGMVTLEMDVARLLTRDTITYETAISAVNDVKTFLTIIERVPTQPAPPQHAKPAAPQPGAHKPQPPPRPTPPKDQRGSWWK
ncbi:MAG: type IV pilus twitching motility protein PilT [Candidatus Abyssobacteria bacterium SURF_5]|uniref:Type IV pilus twitching motility protein PilT n=1 Tax=Abyssobacteria bacterium (strain SURF_5) TaxID=2093360 RepID=A0A3A4NM71_ABYX5|nr:MAG: type IV pilus twitching motility protein PilT [Candidatus Abyssubacteria bacterium SURF_5]